MRSLYIHIPFCVRRCHYCSFPVTTTITEDTQHAYTTKLLQDLDGLLLQYPQVQWDTVYIGGGTPTLLALPHWERLLQTLQPQLRHCQEFTVETNPESTTPEVLSFLHSSGVTRMSLGVQSTDPTILRRLGRQHTVQEITTALETIISTGFQNISADLILGLPGDIDHAYFHSLDYLLTYPITHISAYLLMIKEGSAFARHLPALPPEDYTITSYQHVHERLQREGLERYEVSNWAKPSYACLHNTLTWRHQEYIGLGMGAESYLAHRRFTQPATLHTFLSTPFPEIALLPTQSREETYIERLLLALRLTQEGYHLSTLAAEFPEYASHLITQTDQLLADGLLQNQNNRITSTEEGLLVLDHITSQLLP